MNPKAALLFAIPLCSSVAFAGPLTVDTRAKNIAAAHLEGTWRPKTAFNQTFLAKPEQPFETLTFVKDNDVAGTVPDKHAALFIENKFPVYMSGRFTVHTGDKTLEAPYVLSSIDGNPHVIFWLEKDGDPFGNGESFNVMMAASDDRARDVLFMGGDHATEPFMALERVPAATK